LIGPVVNVPGEQDAGDGDNTGEKYERQADPVCCQVIVDTECRDPIDVSYGEELAGTVAEER